MRLKPMRSMLMLGMMMSLLPLMGCVVRTEVILIPDDGPFILGEEVYSKIGVEDPPGSGAFKWSTERVKIPKGLTVLRYDWSRKVGK